MTEKLKLLSEDLQNQVKVKLQECNECSVVTEFGNSYVIEGKPVILSPTADCQTFTKEDLN